MTTKGWKEDDFKLLAIMIDRYLKNYKKDEDNSELESDMSEAVNRLINKVKDRENGN